MDSAPLTILVVDDNEVDRMTVERALNRRGIASPVVFAGDGLEALERLRSADNRVESPFLVLLDINMPRMSGFEFLDVIRADEELKKSVVIVLTSSEDPDDVNAAYARQAAGYASKEDIGDDFRKLTELIESLERTIRFPHVATGSTA